MIIVRRITVRKPDHVCLTQDDVTAFARPSILLLEGAAELRKQSSHQFGFGHTLDAFDERGGAHVEFVALGA